MIVWIAHAKVGHRQAPLPAPARPPRRAVAFSATRRAASAAPCPRHQAMSLLKIGALFALLALPVLPAAAQVKIGVITSATGPTSFVGTPQKNSVALLPK